MKKTNIESLKYLQQLWKKRGKSTKILDTMIANQEKQAKINQDQNKNDGK